MYCMNQDTVSVEKAKKENTSTLRESNLKYAYTDKDFHLEVSTVIVEAL